MKIIQAQTTLLLTVILITIFFSFYAITTYITTQSQKYSSAILINQLNNTERAVHIWIKGAKKKIQWLTNDDRTVKLLEDIVKTEINTNIKSNIQNKLNNHFSNIIKAMGHKGFFVVSKQYNNISSSRESNIGTKNLTEKDQAFWRQIWRGEIAISSIIKSDVPIEDSDGVLKKDAISMFIGGPIYNKKNQIISALLLRIDPFENYFKIFKAGRLGESGETYTVNSKHIMTSESRFSQHLFNIGLIKYDQTSVLNVKIKAPPCNLLNNKCGYNIEKAPPTFAASSCKDGNIKLNAIGYKDYRGVNVVGSWNWNKELNVCIITEINQDEAYSTLTTITKLIWYLALIISIIFVATILFYTKIRQKTIDERIQKRIATTEKLASLGEMAGALAHEINSPLGAIILNLDELKYLVNQKKSSTDMINELTDDISSSANSISKIVKGIKAFSRQDSKASLIKLNIWDAINEALAISENSLKLYSISTELPTYQPPLFILGNQTALMQVFVNLFTNSKDALKELNEKKWITITVKQQNELVTIIFTDSGSGIPKEIQSKIFTPFFTTKDIGEGTGLGLGISYNIVKAHSGEIRIDDQHKNTRFIIDLPRVV